MTLRLPSPQPSPACGRGGNREEHSWNPDHAPRIRAQQKQKADQDAINDLERRSAPLQWAVMFAAIAITLVAAIDGLSAHIQRYTELYAANEAMVQCLNGKLLKLGGSFVHCDVREIKLVATMEDQQ